MQYRRTPRKNPEASIDMTPLMDLTFMLLIIFVITVPAMYYKSDVKLVPPESANQNKMEVEDTSVFVELDREGAIWIGRGNQRHSLRLVSTEELSAKLAVIKAETPNLTVYLVGDRERQYKEVVDIANAVQHAGIQQLSLVFQPEKKKKQ